MLFVPTATGTYFAYSTESAVDLRDARAQQCRVLLVQPDRPARGQAHVGRGSRPAPDDADPLAHPARALGRASA